MVKQRNTGLISAGIDSLVALALTVGAVVWANQQRMPQGGLTEFLEIRVTMLNASFSIVFAVLWKQCLEALGLYRRDFAELIRPILRTAAACAIMTALLALYLKARHAQGPVPQILLSFFTAVFLYETCRVLISNPQLRWNASEPERVVILGSGRRASKAWRELRIQHHRDKRLLGFVDDRDPAAMPPDIASRFLGSVDELPGYLLRNVVDELIVATPMRSCYDLTQRAVSMAEAAGVPVICLNDVYTLTHAKNLRQRAALFLELVPKDRTHETAEAVKRIVDLLGAAAGLLLLSPLLLLIGVAIRFTSSGPALFVQERYGYGRRAFRMYKFRSMVRNAPDLMTSMEALNEAHGPIFKIKNDPRVTPLGRFLRRTSLDELPQLWNVLLGDMSLVGPRPMSVRDVSLFDEPQLMRRFSVRPGITGIWQVSGRSALSFEQWMALDFSYIDDWSLALDLKILARTLPAVFKRSGAV
jgi:exopolysaccharide biosynthesis polyprenyl glycosylphosphotransferase